MRFMARLTAMGLLGVVALAPPAWSQQAGRGGPGGPGGGVGGARSGPAGSSPAGSGPSSGTPGDGPGGSAVGSPGSGSGQGPPPSDNGLLSGTGPNVTPSGNADADLVRDAVASGQSVPFDQVLATVEGLFGGQIVGVNVSRRPSMGLAYTVKVLTDDGTLRQVVVDARDGTITAVQ